MHLGASVLITLLGVAALLAMAASGLRQPVYAAAALGLVGVVGLPMRGEDGISIALCWLFLLAAGIAVLIVRNTSASNDTRNRSN